MPDVFAGSGGLTFTAQRFWTGTQGTVDKITGKVTVPSARSGADGVEAAVDVQHLACRRGEPVRHQRYTRARDGSRVAQIPAERRPLRPDLLELVEAGDALCRHGA